MNDVLAATSAINGAPGLVIYKVDGNGLSGLWVIRGHGHAQPDWVDPQASAVPDFHRRSISELALN